MTGRGMIWKESREALPPLLLTAGVLLLYVARPLFLGRGAGMDMGGYLNGLFSSGSAVLLFIAVVTGATAYAIEERSLRRMLARGPTAEESRRLQQLDQSDHASRHRLTALFLKLTELGDPYAAEMWRTSRDHLLAGAAVSQGVPYWRYAIERESLLPALPRLGPAGEEILVSLAEDVREEARMRFQAAVLLVQSGRDAYLDAAIDLWQTGLEDAYRTEDRRGVRNLEDLRGFWTDLAPDALAELAAQGNSGAVNAILQNAATWYERKDFGEHARWYEVGTWYWNTRIIALLKKTTGRDFGWDLGAWTAWWDREGSLSRTAEGI